MRQLSAICRVAKIECLSQSRYWKSRDPLMRAMHLRWAMGWRQRQASYNQLVTEE